MKQIPLDSLLPEEEDRLTKAFETMRREIMDRRVEGRAAGIVVRANLSPCGSGTPAILRGFKYTVDWED